MIERGTMTTEEALEITVKHIFKTERRLERAYRQNAPKQDIDNIKKQLEYFNKIEDFLKSLLGLGALIP